MAGSISDNDELMSEINIVPFVDIILVVLITFMVAAPMVVQNAMDIKLTNSSSAAKKVTSKLSVAITNEGQILFNGRVTTEGDVSMLVAEFMDKSPGSKAIISADKNVPHGTVVSIIDAIKAGGVENFAIMVGKK